MFAKTHNGTGSASGPHEDQEGLTRPARARDDTRRTAKRAAFRAAPKMQPSRRLVGDRHPESEFQPDTGQNAA